MQELKERNLEIVRLYKETPMRARQIAARMGGMNESYVHHILKRYIPSDEFQAIKKNKPSYIEGWKNNVQS